MNWLAALGVGLCSAPLVGLIVGTAAALCAEWMRMPNREGAAGFFAIAMTILGAFAGLLLAIGVARGWFGISAGFWKAIGVTVGSVLALSLVVLGFVWLTADFNPKIDGRELDLIIELRYPPGTTPVASNDSYVTLVRLSNGSSAGSGWLDVENARQTDGHYVVPTKLHIVTSAKRKLLNIRLDADRNLFFALDFGAKPGPKDLQWSGWIDAGHTVDEPAPPPEQRFAVRYQVRLAELPPRRLTRAEQEAAEDAEQEAKMRALAPDAPLEAWLIFTRYGVPEARIGQAIAAIRARPQFTGEMAALMSAEGKASQDAFRSLLHMQPPPTELAAAVAAAGSSIAQSLRELELAPSPERESTNAANISSRFSAWIEAARALQGKDGIDFVPQLQEIIEPARKHEKRDALRMDVVRVASFYLHKWGGIEPLPTDPPPR